MVLHAGRSTASASWSSPSRICASGRRSTSRPSRLCSPSTSSSLSKPPTSSSTASWTTLRSETRTGEASVCKHHMMSMIHISHVGRSVLVIVNKGLPANARYLIARSLYDHYMCEACCKCDSHRKRGSRAESMQTLSRSMCSLHKHCIYYHQVTKLRMPL